MYAKTKSLGKNEDAVTPVIGTTLLVGMTVVMITTVAISVLGFALPENVPYAKIVIVEARGDMSEALKDNFIILKHKGGDAIAENGTKVIITGKGCAYATGSLCVLGDMRATYRDLAGENYIESYNGEIVVGTLWDAGETITLYGSDGIAPFGIHHNAVDNKWKLQAGSTVLVTILDITTQEVIAVSQAIVKQA